MNQMPLPAQPNDLLSLDDARNCFNRVNQERIKKHAYAVNSPDTSKDPIACSEDNALDTTYSAQGSHLHRHIKKLDEFRDLLITMHDQKPKLYAHRIKFQDFEEQEFAGYVVLSDDNGNRLKIKDEYPEASLVSASHFGELPVSVRARLNNQVPEERHRDPIVVLIISSDDLKNIKDIVASEDKFLGDQGLGRLLDIHGQEAGTNVSEEDHALNIRNRIAKKLDQVNSSEHCLAFQTEIGRAYKSKIPIEDYWIRELRCKDELNNLPTGGDDRFRFLPDRRHVLLRRRI